MPDGNICPNCGGDNPAGSRFCTTCGSGLAPGTPPHPSRTRRWLEGIAEYTPAGFRIRLLAWLIDWVVLLMIQVFLAAILPQGGFYPFADTFSAVWVVTTPLYYTVGVSVFSTTVGKRVLGLYVLRKDGAKAGFLRALARWFASIVSFMILYIGYLMIATSSDKRGLHDLICGTVVVRRTD